uniref:Uncharacterized protein n=1 Tax=Corethron hystrix TaxID=216773 RepID=A0A7S1BUA7_9STRA
MSASTQRFNQSTTSGARQRSRTPARTFDNAHRMDALVHQPRRPGCPKVRAQGDAGPFATTRQNPLGREYSPRGISNGGAAFGLAAWASVGRRSNAEHGERRRVATTSHRMNDSISKGVRPPLPPQRLGT